MPVIRIASLADWPSGKPKPVREKKPSKYKNRKVRSAEGFLFDSEWEHEVWCDLLRQETHGLIRDLKRQVSFGLTAHGHLICHYRADFTYTVVESGLYVVADAKGARTDIYALKAKLFKAQFGFAITEVFRRPLKPRKRQPRGSAAPRKRTPKTPPR